MPSLCSVVLGGSGVICPSYIVDSIVDLARNVHNRKKQKMLMVACPQRVLAGAQPVPACSACAELRNPVWGG